MGETVGGFICHEVQLPASPIRFSSTRSSGLGRRCIKHSLGQNVRLCLPPDSDLGKSSSQASQFLRRVDSDSSGMGEASLVRESPGTPHRLPSSSSVLDKDATSATHKLVSQKSSSLSSSCVEDIRGCIQKRGFSEAVASRMAQAQKASTLSVYQGKWDLFCVWCKDNKVDPLEVTVPVVTDFLCYLHENKRLALSTIEGYRTAISRMIKASSGVDLGRDPDLTSLLANFERDHSKRKCSAPDWDLSLVLSVLTKAPFEPMHLAPLK